MVDHVTAMLYNRLMNDLIATLSRDLEYVEHELSDDTITIRVRSKRDTVCCPYCRTPSSRVHSRQKRRFQDLPIMDRRCIIELERRKMFCANPDCAHKTFAEQFDCVEPYAQRTKRLNDKVIDTVLDMSSVSAAEQLRNGVCAVSKSTICRELKKKRSR